MLRTQDPLPPRIFALPKVYMLGLKHRQPLSAASTSPLAKKGIMHMREGKAWRIHTPSVPGQLRHACN